MKKLIFLLLLSTAFLCCRVNVFAQSNKGTEFYTTWMAHVNGATGNRPSQMSLYITSDVTTDFTIELADGTIILQDNVTANTVHAPVAIPASAYMGISEAGMQGNKKAIHITSTKPIAVYAHIYSENVSGATLLLPVSALNKDYYSINYKQESNANNVYSNFAVIATEDATTVRIKPSRAIVQRVGNNTLVTHPANQAYDVVLDKGDVYQGAAEQDLTGTSIISVAAAGATDCKKIAVFSGSGKISIGSPNNSSDNLFQQVYPTSVWGKNFITVPLANRNYDVFRIIYSDATAKVTVNGTPVTPNGTGGDIKYYEFETANTAGAANVIKSDKPIQVVQYATTQGNRFGGGAFSGDTGDPEMIFLSPVEQGLKRVTLYSSSFFIILYNYINITIPTIAVGSFTLDGNVYNASAFTPIPGTVYSYAQIPVIAGSHTVTASENFNAVAYGFGSTESYGYAAGTNLLNLNEFIALAGTSATSNPINQFNGCKGVPYFMQLTVPYQPTKIVWDPDDNTGQRTENNPAYYRAEQQANGTVLYTYRFYRPVTYQAGYYSAYANVTLPVVTSNDCGAERRIDFNFYITEYPIADFIPPTNNCVNTPIQFTDGSDPAGSVIVKWEWDFGDAANSTPSNPNTSTSRTPQHTFTQGGRSYNVKLRVTNENGCESLIEAVHPVYINAAPVANFSYTAPYCQGRNITFTDLSTSTNGTITTWEWNFGDGTTESPHTTNAPFTHTFTAVQTYPVTLKVTTSLGCTFSITKNVTVHPLPVVDFKLPDACVADFARFENTSTIPDGSENQFTYEWDFGDGSAKTFTKDGVRKYDLPGIYYITLKITSKDGCVVTSAPKQFLLNGANPVADFKINRKEICSDDNLEIKDQSTVGTGNIVRYAIYYDYENHPTDVTIYDATHNPIPANKIFTHNYGLSAVGPRYFKVKIFIYSGSSASCTAEWPVEVIKVNATPDVEVKQSYTECQETGEITLTTNEKNFAGFGTANFTGAGITNAATGKFDTRKAGPGTHIVHYTFTTLTAIPCTYETDIMVVVNPTPIINGKREYTIQAGESVTLEPQTISLNGSKLTYAWTPKLGLNNPAAVSPVASPSTTTEYTLRVESDNKCEVYAKIKVNVLQAPIAYNTFTPNGDGRNDTWEIPNMVNFPKATVEVFNRNGEKVFNSIGYPVAWDGRYRGVDLPAGVYYYIIDTKNGNPVMSGSVTIIR